jgi:hypothetical protein
LNFGKNDRLEGSLLGVMAEIDQTSDAQYAASCGGEMVSTNFDKSGNNSKGCSFGLGEWMIV